MALQFFLLVTKVHNSPRAGFYYDKSVDAWSSAARFYIEYTGTQYHVQARLTIGSSSWFHYSLGFRLFGRGPDSVTPAIRGSHADKNEYENLQYGGSQASWGSRGYHAQNPTGTANRVFSFTTDLYWTHEYTTDIPWEFSSLGTYGSGFRVNTASGTKPIPPRPEPPYTAPSVAINEYNQIGRRGYTDWWAKYTVSKGTDNISWSRIQLYDWNTDAWKWYTEIGGNNYNQQTNWYAVPNNNFNHGTQYRARVSSYDGKNEVWTNPWAIYTYTWPDLSTFSINKAHNGSSYTISGDQSWTVTLTGTNNRNFNTLENEFETHHYITNGSNSWANKGNVTSYTNNASYEGTQITDAKDGQAVTYNVSRYAPSPQYRTSKTASIIFYYRPRYPATNYAYYKNNASGTNYPHGETVVNDNTLSGIYVKWNSTTSDAKTYGTTKKDDAGQVDGYRIELREKYSNGTYSGVYKTYYVSAGNCTIPKGDIRKLVMQQIRITPYYIHSSTEKWYYNSPVWEDFIILRSSLNNPVISYPKNNTTWHNRDLRILFQLPIDPDKDEEESTYKYNNVEVEVTNQVGTKYYVCMRDTVGRTPGGTISNACFNIQNISDANNNLTYQRKMVCAPSIVSNYPFDNATQLKYRVRVQSRWIPTSLAPMWSAWSNQVTVNITTISFNPSVGDYIMATHYNTMITKAKTAYDVYPGFTWTKPTNVVAKSTIIKADQYKVPFASPVGIKNFVNSGYGATFDAGYEKAKFDSAGKIVNFDPVAARYEYVTALTDPRPNPKGRDYIKMVYDWLNYLKD